MSRMGSYFMDMQEDAVRMGLQEFIQRYGFSAAEVWHDANFGDDRDCDRYFDEDEGVLYDEA